MPATSRRVPGHIGAPARALAAAAVVFGCVSCSGLDQASAGGVTPHDLVSEVADQLAGGSSLAYTATYRLAGGTTAHIARTAQPPRAAYVYPEGRLIRTEAALTRCDRKTCTATEPGGADELPAGSGMVTPDSVLALLESAAIDPDLEMEQQDTTRAGRHATCVEIRGVENFGACVTVEGALAGFTGRVDGTPVEMVLVEYVEEVQDLDFMTPPGTPLIDRRGK